MSDPVEAARLVYYPCINCGASLDLCFVDDRCCDDSDHPYPTFAEMVAAIRAESAGTPHYPSCNDRCIHYLLGDESVRDEMLPVFSDENPVAVGCQSRQGVVTDSSLESAGTGLDVERLARAMDHADPSISDEDTEMDREEHRAYAREIAAEYARLSSSDTER